MISVSVQGAEKVLAALDQAATKTERKIVTAVYASAFRIQAAARRAVGVDTGRLRSSVFVRFLEGGKAAEVGTDVFYGPFQEYGTRYMSPRPFLVPAYEAEREKFLARIERITSEVAT